MAQAQTTYQGVPPEKPTSLTVAEYMALEGDFEIRQGELVEMSPNTRRPDGCCWSHVCLDDDLCSRA
jgi:hypothetical protein